MAADDELPRGWTQNSLYNNGGNDFITYPAIPGISWVLTQIDANISVYPGGALPFGPLVLVNGVFYGALGISIENNNPYQNDEWQYNGGPIAFPVGEAVTISYNATSGDWLMSLIATAYPV
jgi:hypothetical protein